MSRLIPLFSSMTGLSEADVWRIIINAPVRYKTYTIDKRNGDKRIISQPSRELKALQRVLIAEVLNNLPIYAGATAYETGSSIKKNAEMHAGKGPILKFDFKEFFPSILERDWREYCRINSVFDDRQDVEISSKVLFHRQKRGSLLRLAIGAPSSPRLSNILMYEFDTKVAALVAKDKVVYTRYADDLTFSARRIGNLNNVEKKLRRVIRDIRSPSLRLNEAKQVLATMKYRRVVTGLVLANDGTISLGRERKKEIRAMVHYAQQGKLDNLALLHLSGLLAFVQDVELGFLQRLERKYGEELIADIRSTQKELVQLSIPAC